MRVDAAANVDGLTRWCPSCGARPGALCSTGSGRVLDSPHLARVTARERRTPKAKPGPTKATRVALVRRAGGWCETCPLIDPGAPEHPGREAHHKRRRSQGGADDLDNLLWTCRRGHRLIHDNPLDAYRLGLLVRSTDA